MTVERARVHFVPKSWGSEDLRPWNSYHDTRTPIGEVWFERPDSNAAPPALLMKLIFTGESHSDQTDSNVAIARGLSQNGCDAWYILSAGAESRIAVGLARGLSREQLRVRILDGSILETFAWKPARAGDSTFVPPDMFQAIGSGLAIVEIQQRMDSTIRVLDPGRRRACKLQPLGRQEILRPSERRSFPRKLTPARELLLRNPAFVLERMTLAPGVVRELDVLEETWLFVLAGGSRVDSVDIELGNAIFLQNDMVRIEVGAHGFQCLVAYARSAPAPCLLVRQNGIRVPDSRRSPSRTSLQLESVPIMRSVPTEGNP